MLNQRLTSTSGYSNPVSYEKEFQNIEYVIMKLIKILDEQDKQKY